MLELLCLHKDKPVTKELFFNHPYDGMGEGRSFALVLAAQGDKKVRAAPLHRGGPFPFEMSPLMKTMMACPAAASTAAPVQTEVTDHSGLFGRRPTGRGVRRVIRHPASEELHISGSLRSSTPSLNELWVRHITTSPDDVGCFSQIGVPPRPCESLPRARAKSSGRLYIALIA